MFVTYGVKLDAGVSIVTAAMLDVLHEAFFDAIKDTTTSEYNLTATVIEYLIAGELEKRVATHVETKGLLGGPPSLPQSVALLLQKRTGLSGRRNRGRMYLPGINEAVVDSRGQVLAASIASLNASLATWLGKFGTIMADFDNMVILHSLGISGAPPPTVVTQMLVDPVAATQRRRLR
jgi:hypothetical protein